MMLKEILDMAPLPYQWIDDSRCIFDFNDKKFGILVDYQELRLLTRSISVTNISFGIIKSNNKIFQSNDLDTSINNFGKPRTILSTVATACIDNDEIGKSDIISLAASYQVKEKRIFLYSLAGSEIKNKFPEFRGKDILIKTPNGSIAFLLSKIEFTENEQIEIKRELKLDKI